MCENRGGVRWAFLFAYPGNTDMEKLRLGYADLFPSKAKFKEVYQEITQNKRAMVVKLRNAGPRLCDKIFKFDAKKVPGWDREGFIGEEGSIEFSRLYFDHQKLINAQQFRTSDDKKDEKDEKTEEKKTRKTSIKISKTPPPEETEAKMSKEQLKDQIQKIKMDLLKAKKKK